MDNALELLVRVQTQGQAALTELANATKQVGTEGQKASTTTTQASDQLTKALVAQIGRYKDLGSAAAQSAMQALNAINPVVAQEQQLRIAAEQAAAAIVKEGAAFDQAGQKMKQHGAAVEGGIGSIGEKLKSGLANPMGTASSMLEGFIGKLGAIPGVAAGAAAGLGLAATAALEMASHAAEAAQQQINMAERTGLTVKEVVSYSRAAKVMGVDINSMVTAMRTMSMALSENSEEGKKGKAVLAELGVTAYDATGVMKPMGQLWMEIADGLSKIENPAQRAEMAIKLFGRGGLELLPLLRGNFRELTEEMKKFGFESGVSAEQADEYHQQLTKLKIAWDALYTSMGRKIIGVISILREGFSGDNPGIPEEGEAYDRKTHKRNDNALTPEPKQYSYADLLKDMKAAGQEMPKQDFSHGINISGAMGPVKSPEEIRAGLLAQNNKAIESLSSSLITPDDKLKALDKEIDGLRGKLKTDVFPAVNAATVSAIKQKQGERDALAASIEAQKNAAKELAQIQQAADRALQSAQLAELSGLAKLRAERDMAIQQTAKLGKNGVQAATEFKQAFDLSGKVEALKELEKMMAEMKREGPLDANMPKDLRDDKTALRQKVGQTYLAVQAGNMPLDELASKLAEINSQVQDVFMRQNWFESQAKGAKDFTDKLKKQLAEDKQALDELHKQWDAAVAPEKGKLQGEQQGIRDKATREIRMAQAQADSGNEMSILNKITGIKKQAAADEYNRAMALAKLHWDDAERQQAEAKALEAAKRQMDDAELDRTITIMQLRKKELEQFRESAGRIFDAITQKGISGMGDVFKGMLQTIERTLFQNVAEEIFKGVRDKLKLGDMIGGQTDKNGNLTTMGRILKGTPFGIDPAQLAQQQHTKATTDQTQATKEQTQATKDLTEAMKAGKGGSGGSGAGDGSSDAALDDIISGADSDAGSAGSSTAGKMSGLTKTLGKALAIGAGAAGVYAGIKMGGAKGAVTALGSAAGAAAALDPEPVSKAILGGFALVSGFISSMFGDPKAKFDKDQTAALQAAGYSTDSLGNVMQGAGWVDGVYHPGKMVQVATRATTGQNTLDLNGNDVDYNYQGKLRASTPQVTQMNFNISAMDAKSFMDRSSDIATAVQKELRLGHPVGLNIQQAILGT